jgi:hypothetical protein
MMRKFFPFVIAAVILSSCGNTSNKEASNKAKNLESATKIEFAALAENPDNYIDKNVIVEGKVVHVCPHTGKKMFIVGENPDIMLYVTAGDNTPKFPMELLGSEISVEGVITRAVTAEKPAETAMNLGTEAKACCDSASKAGVVCKDSTSKAVNAAECETEAAFAKQSTLADLMMIYNKHTVK